MLPSQALPSLFRNRAQMLRNDYGIVEPARSIEWCAEKLERALQEQDNRLLNLQEAAQLSGYTADHLGRMVRDGDIPNAGRPGAPKIRIKDLPRKATNGLPAVATEPPIREIENAQIVQSIIEEGGR